MWAPPADNQQESGTTDGFHNSRKCTPKEDEPSCVSPTLGTCDRQSLEPSSPACFIGSLMVRGCVVLGGGAAVKEGRIPRASRQPAGSHLTQQGPWCPRQDRAACLPPSQPSHRARSLLPLATLTSLSIILGKELVLVREPLPPPSLSN